MVELLTQQRTNEQFISMQMFSGLVAMVLTHNFLKTDSYRLSVKTHMNHRVQ